MSEQLPKDEMTLNMVALDGERAQVARALGFIVLAEPHTAAREIVSLRDQLTDLRASLRREENARKVLADENTRLTKKSAELYQHVTDLIEECQAAQRQLAAWVIQS